MGFGAVLALNPLRVIAGISVLLLRNDCLGLFFVGGIVMHKFLSSTSVFVLIFPTQPCPRIPTPVPLHARSILALRGVLGCVTPQDRESVRCSAPSLFRPEPEAIPKKGEDALVGAHGV